MFWIAGANKTALITYAALDGIPIPKIITMTIAINKAINKLPEASSAINELSLKPKPV